MWIWECNERLCAYSCGLLPVTLTALAVVFWLRGSKKAVGCCYAWLASLQILAVLYLRCLPKLRKDEDRDKQMYQLRLQFCLSLRRHWARFSDCEWLLAVKCQRLYTKSLYFKVATCSNCISLKRGSSSHIQVSHCTYLVLWLFSSNVLICRNKLN